MARDSKDGARADDTSAARGGDLHDGDPWLESSGTFRRAPMHSDIRELQVDVRPPAAAVVDPALDEQTLKIPHTTDLPTRNLRYLVTRVISGLTLAVVLAGVYKLSIAGYYIATDSFVAPLILSPDSDAVLPSKLNLVRIMAERAALIGRIDQAEASLVAANQGTDKLNELKGTLTDALGFTQSVTSQMVSAGSQDLAALAEQRRLIERRASEQEARMKDLERQMELGLLRRSDVQRERDMLNELRLAAIQNERDKVATSAQLHSSSLAQRAMGNRERGISTPEMVQQREQLIRLELDLLKLQAEKIGKSAELRVARDELLKLDGLIQQVKERPIFRAIESRQNVAFVPYTQIGGVEPGAPVISCGVWGMLDCRRVGRVTHILPGEVAAQDPWGAPSRGQYALLQLEDLSAATAKVLRVRTGQAKSNKLVPHRNTPATAPVLSKM